MPQTRTYVRGTCKKCAATIRVELTTTLEELQKDLAQPYPYECPGQHQEFGPMLNDYTWDWTPTEAPEPPTDEEYCRQLIRQHGKDRIFYLGNPSIGEALGIASLHAFRDLEHLGFGDFGNKEFYFARNDSPRHTTRFYVQERR